MADGTEARFDAAVNVVRSIPKKGPYQPSYDTMLKFYAYYKQAKEGECLESKPGFWDVVRKAKWEAWHALGKMSKQEAMESYVSELKKAIENVPDSEKADELNTAFKNFYQIVYENQEEPPPAALRVFEDKAASKDKICKDFRSNGHQSPELENMTNERIEMLPVHGIHSKLDANGTSHMNGYPHKGFMDKENGKGCGVNGGHVENGFNAVVVSSDKLKDNFSEEEDNDSGIQNGDVEGCPGIPSYHGSIPLQSGPIESNGVNVSTDESEEEEFCDSLEPEHLIQEIQNEHDQEDCSSDTILKTDTLNSGASSSTEQVGNSVYPESSQISDFETEINGSQLLTSTPFAKHVTFAVDGSEAVKPIETLLEQPSMSEECHLVIPLVKEGECASEANSDLKEYETVTPLDHGSHKLTGILKQSSGGKVCGGGDGGGGPPATEQAQTIQTRTPQGRRTKDSASSFPGFGHPSREYRQRSDSDTDDDDDDDHTSGPDYDSAGDSEVNNKILEALNRLHQDMKSVLSRLGSLENAIVARQNDLVSSRSEPWWKAYVPSKAVFFLILWPFIVNIVINYFRRQKRN